MIAKYSHSVNSTDVLRPCHLCQVWHMLGLYREFIDFEAHTVDAIEVEEIIMMLLKVMMSPLLAISLFSWMPICFKKPYRISLCFFLACSVTHDFSPPVFELPTSSISEPVSNMASSVSKPPALSISYNHPSLSPNRAIAHTRRSTVFLQLRCVPFLVESRGGISQNISF